MSDDERTTDLPIGEWLSDLATQEGREGGPRTDEDAREVSATVSVPVAAEPHVEATERMALDATQRMRIAGAPENIGRYRVVARLGAGGMAEVFHAQQAGPGGFEKDVVVKRSLPHLRDNPRFVEMFLREARIAARLNHPNIVQIYELGEDGDDYFIAMEHVEGLSLHRLARRAWRKEVGVPMEVVLRAIADAAAGLAYAHEQRGADGEPLRLVHRDISPDNLMINREGVTKLLDFGIAKAADTETLTKSGEIKGKIPFMSPEQIRGEPLDHRTDLYALGVCVYWLLTGRRPFVAGSDFLTMNAVLEEQPRPPSAINPQVPPEVDRVVMRLLEKDPAARFQSGRELATALSAMLPGGYDASARFLRDALAWPDPPPGEMTLTGSGFLPATPVSSRLRQSPFAGGGESDTVRHPTAAKPRRPRWVPVAVGGVSTLFGVGAAVIIGLVITSDPAPPPRASVSPVVTPPPSAKPPPPAEPPAEEPPAEEPSAPAPPAAEPPPPAAEPPPPVEPKPKPKPRARRARPAPRKVSARGPASVRWRIGRRTAGRGNASLSLPPGTEQVVADNPALGHTVLMSVDGGLDYGALPEGNVEFRVFPYARVKLGNTVLGTTPMTPKRLAIGRYRVTLQFEDEVYETSFEVKKGKRAVVKKSFGGG